ncbi:hypothetical protein V9L05_11400 [Bernardetia sp. Wsw4-3y2]|uniref:hypothetical protein n=1 Tax=unclassified Bernardetia TaxID=2647129 RepID=UPI0030D4D6E0
MIKQILILFFLVSTFFSCTVKPYQKETVYQDSKISISIYPTSEENKRFIRELIYTNDKNVLLQSLETSDTTILSKISFDIVEEENLVKLQVMFVDEAIEYKEKIKNYISYRISQKQQYEMSNLFFLTKAEDEGHIIIDLLKENLEDVVWQEHSSQHLYWRATPDEFKLIADKIRNIVNLSQEYVLFTRVPVAKVKGIDNQLFSFHYRFEDGKIIEMIIEDIAGIPKLVAIEARDEVK